MAARKRSEVYTGPIKAHEASTEELDDSVIPHKDTTMRMRQKEKKRSEENVTNTVFHVYAADDMKNIISSYTDSIYLKHNTAYESFNKNDEAAETFIGSSRIFKDVRPWSW